MKYDLKTDTWKKVEMFIRNTAQILILVNMHHPHLRLVLYELTQDESSTESDLLTKFQEEIIKKKNSQIMLRI